MDIHLQQLIKHYGATVALDGIDVTLPSGKVTAIVGPSGSGKSSLLNLIAGLLRPTSGRILFGDRDVTGVPTEERDIGYVFQSYALFPHLTVRENVAFGVDDKARRESVANEMMQRFRIDHFADRRPQQLSGGERQRVALARALAREPQILLFDEPLSALDAQLREELRRELVSFFHEFDRTSVYVTHDRQEAMLLADHVLVLRSGKVLQAGTPEELYRRPSSAFVATFFGDANLIPGRVDATGHTIETTLGRFAITHRDDVVMGDALLVLRPEMFALADRDCDLSVVVERASFLGPRWRVIGRCGDLSLVIDLPPTVPVRRGQKLDLSVTQEWIHVVPAQQPAPAFEEETHDSRRQSR